MFATATSSGGFEFCEIAIVPRDITESSAIPSEYQTFKPLFGNEPMPDIDLKDIFPMVNGKLTLPSLDDSKAQMPSSPSQS